MDEYSDYIKANTEEGTRVECCVPGVGVGVGEQGRVTRNNGDFLEVSWDNGMDYGYGYGMDYWEVKLVASVANRNLMAD